MNVHYFVSFVDTAVLRMGFILSHQYKNKKIFCRKFANKTVNNLNDVTRDRIDGYVKSDNVVVFMKGTQQQPMCGFSNNVKRILDLHQVKFKDYNVLEDEELRNGIKIYSDWPTIPQIYIKGNFIGGSDIFIQLHRDGEITALFDENKISSKFSDNLPIQKIRNTQSN